MTVETWLAGVFVTIFMVWATWVSVMLINIALKVRTIEVRLDMHKGVNRNDEDY